MLQQNFKQFDGFDSNSKLKFCIQHFKFKNDIQPIPNAKKPLQIINRSCEEHIRKNEEILRQAEGQGNQLRDERKILQQKIDEFDAQIQKIGYTDAKWKQCEDDWY